MTFRLGLVVAAGAAVAISGQSTIPPVIRLPVTMPAGPTRPPAKPPVTFTPKAIPSAEIGGRVVADGNSSIAGATVWLVGQDAVRRATTDGRGRFMFTGVPSGEYVVLARKRGFLDGAFGKKRANGAPLPLSIGAGQAAGDMQIELFRAGVIAGSIFDEANEPVVGARVVAIRRFFWGGDWQFVAAGSTTTDDEGRYRVYDLPPGEYIVSTPTTQLNVAVPDAPLFAAGVPFTETPDLAYPTLFYAATRFSLLSLPVRIGSGEVRYAVNFQWAPVPARSIAGNLVGTREQIGGKVVKLVPTETREMGLSHESAVTISAADGTFAFERVPAGEYRVEAGGAFGPPRLTEIAVLNVPAAAVEIHWGREYVTVLDEDVKDLKVQMQEGHPVTGHIDAPAGVQWSHVSIAIVPAVPGLSRATAPSIMNGEFETVPLVPGRYFIRVTGLPPGLYLRSIDVNGDNALDGSVTLGGLDEPSIDVTLTDEPTKLTGDARDAHLLPASGAAILVFPAAASQWSPNRSRETRASMNGQFAITGLPPGDYLIVAMDDAAADGWQDEALLSQLRTLATRVSLKAQENRALQLRVSQIKR